MVEEGPISQNQLATWDTFMTVGYGIVGMFSQRVREEVMTDIVKTIAWKGAPEKLDAAIVNMWGPSARQETLNRVDAVYGKSKRETPAELLAPVGKFIANMNAIYNYRLIQNKITMTIS